MVTAVRRWQPQSLDNYSRSGIGASLYERQSPWLRISLLGNEIDLREGKRRRSSWKPVTHVSPLYSIYIYAHLYSAWFFYRSSCNPQALQRIQSKRLRI